MHPAADPMSGNPLSRESHHGQTAPGFLSPIWRRSAPAVCSACRGRYLCPPCSTRTRSRSTGMRWLTALRRRSPRAALSTSRARGMRSRSADGARPSASRSGSSCAGRPAARFLHPVRTIARRDPAQPPI